MNSIMTFSCSSIVAVLIVYVSGAEQVPGEIIKTFNSPYNFNFSSYDHMNSVITLKNIPSSVTTVSLIYSGQHSFNLRLSGKTLEILKVDKEIKDGQATIPFLRTLEYYERIWIDVELKTTEGLCTKSELAEGRYTYTSNYWDYTMRELVTWTTNWSYYDGTGSCLSPKKCEIVIDFHNQCEETFSCYHNATKYTCTLHRRHLKNLQTYELHQTFNDEPFIDFFLNITYTNTKLIIELESFDNNTSVNVVKSKKKSDLIWSHKIILTAKDVVKDNGVRILHYSESTAIQFRCDEYIFPPKITKAFTVLINTKENKIQAYHEAEKVQKYRIPMEDNGFILGCLYYSNEWVPDGEYWQITRVVANQTLLMYQPEEPVSDKVENPAKKLACALNSKKYTCTLQHEKLENSQTYKLEHIYDIEPLIAVHLKYTSATNTELIMELESFDNNTSMNVVKLENNNDVWSNNITLTEKPVDKDKIVATLNYSESTDIQFNCEEYISPPQVKGAFTVLINKKENKIKLLDKATKIIDKYRIKMEDNGSTLCCMYYSCKSSVDGEYLQITRVVANKTLLIYQPKETLSSKVENTADTKDLAMSSTQSSNIWIAYVLAPIIGVSVLILALCCISKQGWITKSGPVEETVELDNNTHQNQVLYADLDFVRTASQQSQDQNGEAYYATIIGVLHPHKKNIQ